MKVSYQAIPDANGGFKLQETITHGNGNTEESIIGHFDSRTVAYPMFGLMKRAFQHGYKAAQEEMENND